MNYNLKNNDISIEIGALGAEMQHFIFRGRELLWHGDKQFWGQRSPVLFPYIGRLVQGKYTYKGQIYEMKIHGFARNSTFELLSQTEDSLTLALQQNEETLRQYPFPFRLTVAHQLLQNGFQVQYSVENTGNETMIFSIGGHPGFLLPLDEGLAFEDYQVVFDKPCTPKRVTFSKDVFVDGQLDYPLQDNQILPLSHSLFDDDAIILSGYGQALRLQSKKGPTALHVEAPGFPYMGFWQMPHTEAPFLCIEPWSSLPARAGGITDLEEQADLLHLEPGKTKQLAWSVQI